MNLDDLIAHAGTSLNDKVRYGIDAARFRSDIEYLSRFAFWAGRRNHRRLWDHQKAAVATVAAYLNGDKRLPERPEHIEAALLKLPTGTGKSGIIAVVARCLPRIRKVLVLTPRTALTEQLLDDVRWRFWGHLNYKVDAGHLFTAAATKLGAELEDAYTEIFLPTRVPNMLRQLKGAERAVLVGTHQALADIRKCAAKTKCDGNEESRHLLKQIRSTFDLVIVDEGHYEPAVSWSRGVREFNLPTLLLSATPYRNDYKSFRVRGRYVFNYPYAEAVRDRIIRPAEIVVPSGRLKCGRKQAMGQFIETLKDELPSRLEKAACWFDQENTPPKVMVRADDLETLELLQVEIDRAFDTESVLIHERASKTDEKRRRFRKVRSALRACKGAQFWIHQNKLMEGIDDPSFVVVAIYDLMSNARQLVQQIGRATRYSNSGRKKRQTAWIIGSLSNAQRIETSWYRYKAYEQYVAGNTAFVVANEATMPDRLLEYMAKYQYIDGEFRGRFEIEAPLDIKDIQLPLSAVVLALADSVTNISGLSDAIEEAIMDKDRFKTTPLTSMPKNSIGFSYYAWRNSPYLRDRFFSEWKFGIFIAVKQGDYVFMHDTEGLVVDLAQLGLRRIDRCLMEKIFPEGTEDTSSRLSRMSFLSLEMSQQAIRSMAVRTRSFAEVFTDLLDPSLVPASAFGYVNGTGRYVGFARARLREMVDRLVPANEYFGWTRQVARELADVERSRSSVFGRYASVVDGLSEEDAQPVSILIDPSQDAFLDMREDEATVGSVQGQVETEYDDLCADIDEDGEFVVKLGDDEVACSIMYDEVKRKYYLRSQQLNELFPVAETNGRRQSQTLVQRLNKKQAFRILVKRDGIVYSEGRFYEPRNRWVTEDGSQPILDHIFSAESLHDVNTEKGEDYLPDDREDWYRRSIFGVLAATVEGRLGHLDIPEDDLTNAISSIPIWLCDDDAREIADFVGIDEDNKKLVFVHAKVGSLTDGGGGFNVPSLQIVGRQAIASLGFMSRGQPSEHWTAQRWSSEVQANAVRLVGRNRIFGNPEELTAEQLNNVLRRACSNPSFDKEMWILGARMTRRAALSTALGGGRPFNNRLTQFLMHWDGLQTACARASVRLRFYCS